MSIVLKRILKIVALVLVLCILTAAVYSLIAFIRYKSVSSRCEEQRAIPRVDVLTENEAEIESKEEYVKCSVSVSGTEIQSCSAGIRGRGNTTWQYFPKKPYRIKFDEKVSVFGEEKNKSWVLLALYNDFSVVKDRLAFTMADALGTDVFVPSYNYVELYLNGEYNGLYLMTDQVDENKGRAAVKSDDVEHTELIEVPFLVELDDYAPSEGTEGVDWFKVAGRPYNIKYPEADERNEAVADEQFAYIQNYINRVDAACRAGDLATLSELVDIDTFIDFYIVQEVMGQPEINWKSVYMYKSQDGKMKMGPVWDFDWSAMGPSLGDEKNAYRDKTEGLRSIDNWFDNMQKKSPEFKAMVSTRLEEAKPKLMQALNTVKADEARIADYALRNHLRWHWYRVGSSQSDCYAEVISWCEARIDWLSLYFKSENG